MIIKNESQAIEFQKEIDKLKAHEGGDCPENTLAGILGAVDKVQFPDSPLYVFTDAGPKDATEDKISRVRAAAKEKRLTINFMLTGNKEKVFLALKVVHLSILTLTLK